MEKTNYTDEELGKLSAEQLVKLVRKLLNRNIALLHQLFAPRSERSKKDDPNARPLFDEVEQIVFDENNQPSEDEESTVKEHKRKSRGKRKPIPDDLPRERREFDLDEKEKICITHSVLMEKIGENITEQLSIVPAQIKVIQNVTFTYKCPCCVDELNGGIIKSKKTEEDPIPKSIATPELLSFIATSKYEDSLPLYRQEKIFTRYNIDISRNTMARWMIKAADLVQPLLNLMHEDLLQSPVIQCDETPVQVLKEKDRSAEQKSYMWLLAKSYGSPLLLFSYYETRGNHAAKDLLRDFKGVLVCDGLKTYDSTAKFLNIILAGCMAHVRRKFFLAEKEEKRVAKKGSIIGATQALIFIRNMYKIESEIKGKDPDKILEIRKEKTKPILDQFHFWLLEQSAKTPPQSLFGKAINYALSQWDKLLVFCTSALVPIDNNYTEAHIRPFVIGRNNWVFSVTPEGAHASAALYSLIESAKANRILPYQYLTLIFKELPKAKTLESLEKLLPYKVKDHFPIQSYEIPQ